MTTIAIPSVNIFVFLSIRFLNHFLGHAFLNTLLLRSGNKGRWFSLFKFNYVSAGVLKEYLFLFNKVIFNKFCSSQINSQTPQCEWITSLLLSVPQFNSTRKAVKLLFALDNVKNDFKRPALTMNHISESIIRGVFPKIVRFFANLDRRKCHTFIQLCQTLQHIAKVFAPFPFSHVI